ncbi:MAG: Brp/Blh family beta-carotene 15,15'-dioxygenase [Actinomycetota bacterium]
MTATIETADDVGGHHATAVFRPALLAIALVASVSAVWSVPDPVAVSVATAAVIALGIPHGALDHLVVETLDGRTDGSRRRFVRNYAAAMAGAGLIWLASPPLALAAFLLISVHHFGQSDLAHLRLGGVRQIALQWSRGLLLVGLPLVAHVEVVAPVIADLGGGDVAAWTWMNDRWWMWAGALIVQHAVVGAALVAPSRSRATLVREATAVAALTALFLTAHPLVGFAVYFGLWHALGHLVVLAEVLGVRERPVRSMISLAAPLTAVSVVGLAVAWVGATMAGRADLLVPVMFVFVSMLTVPHLVVVERLWRDR